jgi:maltose alpha-D-glucosyltransferase/alpha-amylase
VSGFRLDAVPFLIEHLGLEKPPQQEESEYLSDLRRFLSWRKAESILLAEANVTMKDVTEYFGPDGDRMHMVFNFLLNQHLFLALVRKDAEPIRRVMSMMPDLPVEGQWGTFLRNHDELDLGRLSAQERQEVCDAMAPDPGMVIYDRGIRRRLAPMLAGDLRRLKLAYSLMFALPGTPVLWYGEEIGMGEDLTLKEREAVRTPLQWSASENGGFSSASRRKLIRPVAAEGPYGYKAVNIEAQLADANSLLHFMRELIRVRRGAPEVGWGRWKVLETDTRVLGLTVEWQRNTIATFHNVSDREVDVNLEGLQDEKTASFTVLLNGPDASTTAHRRGKLTLPPYGYAWLRLASERR